MSIVALTAPALGKTPLEHLRDAPAPYFRPGHTLPPLSRWGWSMDYDVRVELCEHWGYALEFGDYAGPEHVKQLDDPKSEASRICALTASDPKKYPLAVLTHRGFPANLPDDTWTHDADGKLPGGEKIWSPEAPDSVFEQAGQIAADPLRKIRQKCPIAILLNGGEYALSVYGHHGKYWAKDPKIVKAKGERSWFEYISDRKEHQEFPIARAIRDAAPDRELYIYYYADGGLYRNRSRDWWTWANDYRYMRHVSDLPSTSIYYRDFNSGWAGDNDMLTQVLNTVGLQIAYGEPLSYNWVNGGYTREKLGEAAFGDLDRYTGFLKCLYTAGNIGAVAGYFSFDKGFTGDQGERPPHWLRQMMILGQVHALFSHLEDFLREGYLVPGPDRHRWSKDTPAYELPSGVPGVRVLARKHRIRPEWLITAWAAGGDDRTVSVTVPDLGKVDVLARRAGTVYRAELAGAASPPRSENGEPVPTLIDKDPLRPSERLGQ